MEIVKSIEEFSRTYDGEGAPEDKLRSVSYKVEDAEGNVVGEAQVTAGGLNINIYSIMGYDPEQLSAAVEAAVAAMDLSLKGGES